MTETTEAPPAKFEPSGRSSWDLIRLVSPEHESEFTRAAGQVELRELAKNSPAALAALDASGDQSLSQWHQTVRTNIGSAISSLSAMESVPAGTPTSLKKLHAELAALRSDASQD